MGNTNPEEGTATIKQCPPPILRLPGHFQTTKRGEATPIAPIGSCHRPEARSPPNPHQQNHTSLAVGIRRTHQVLERTHSVRNHLTFKKPLCHVFLFYKEKEWQTMPSTGLLTSKHLDCQKLLPTAPHSPVDWLTSRIHPLHWVQCWVGVQ